MVCKNKKNLWKTYFFLILILAMVSCSTNKRDQPQKSKENYTIGLKCFIGSDGKEYSALRTGSFVNCPKNTTIVASVFQLGKDSVQIMYSSPEYGNGEYSWTTSLSNYNSYETHHIRTLVFELRNVSSGTTIISDSTSIN